MRKERAERAEPKGSQRLKNKEQRIMIGATAERVRDLLGAGASQVQVAMAVGVDESYVSQLMASEEFRAEVQERRAAAAAQRAGIDKKIDSIEEKAWAQIDKLVGLETNLMKLLKVAQGANAAKRRTDPVQGSQNQGGAVVNINLPVNSLMQFKMTSDRQVIEVDGRSMNTMQSAKVQELARAVKLAENTVPQVSEASRKLLESF